MTLSNWIVEKYFIKCKNCGWEIIIGERHTAPRKCPNCDAVMMETMEGEKKTVIKTNLREALRMCSELYTPKYPCINRLEEEK